MNYKRICAHLGMCAVLLATAWGCGNQAKREPAKSISVNGTLLVNGKPFGPAVLSFVPLEEGAPGIEAHVNKDGTFDRLNYKAGDSEPGGKYKVVLSEDPEEMVASAIPDAQPVTVEIQTPAEGETLKLEIKMTAKGGTRTGGPDPDAVGPAQPKGPGGI